MRKLKQHLYWCTKDGENIRFDKLDDGHLANIIAMLEKKATKRAILNPQIKTNINDMFPYYKDLVDERETRMARAAASIRYSDTIPIMSKTYKMLGTFRSIGEAAQASMDAEEDADFDLWDDNKQDRLPFKPIRKAQAQPKKPSPVQRPRRKFCLEEPE